MTQSRNTHKIRRAFTIASESRALKWVQLEVSKRYTSVAATNKLVVPGSKIRMASKASRTTLRLPVPVREAQRKKFHFHPIFAVFFAYLWEAKQLPTSIPSPAIELFVVRSSRAPYLLITSETVVTFLLTYLTIRF